MPSKVGHLTTEVAVLHAFVLAKACHHKAVLLLLAHSAIEG